jgi:hypothetical protein
MGARYRRGAGISGGEDPNVIHAGDWLVKLLAVAVIVSVWQ